MPFSSFARDQQSARRSGRTIRTSTESYHLSSSLTHPNQPNGSESLSLLSGPDFWGLLLTRAYEPGITPSPRCPVNPPASYPAQEATLPQPRPHSRYEQLNQSPIHFKTDTSTGSESESLGQIRLQRVPQNYRIRTPGDSSDSSRSPIGPSQLHNTFRTSVDKAVSKHSEDTPNNYDMLTRARKKEDKHQAHLKEPKILAQSTDSSRKRKAQQGIEHPLKLQKTDRMSVGPNEAAQESSSVIGAPKLGERSSVSRNLAEYMLKLGVYDESRKRIQELKVELQNEEWEHEASVNMLKHNHEIVLQHFKDAHNTALEKLGVENGAKLQQIEQDYELQLEQHRRERQDIKESADENEKKQEETVQALRAENMSLKKQLEDEKSARKISTGSLTSEVNFLKEQVVEFYNRDARGGASKYSSTPTPYLSSSDETKEGNIRKIHAKYKKRYDNLYGLGQNIEATTANMDLAAFGKFGKDIQRLRMNLEEIREEDRRELKRMGQAKELNI